MPRLAPVVSALARQTMKAAFEDLEQTVKPTDAQEMCAITTIEHVRKAALRIENQLAARQSLRNMRRLTPLLNGIEHYARVIDLLCNGTPYLSWVWSPISLILRVASEFVEAFEKIMKGYSKIAESLVRFEILSEAYATNSDFQQSLACYYADILHFHKQAYILVRQSSWRILFIASWGRFERRFDHILEDLDRHGALIDNEASARNIAESRRMREEIQTWKEKSLERIEKDDQHQQIKDFEAILTWLKIDGSEQATILDSVSAEQTMYPGTSAWLLKNEKIKTWLKRSSESPLLWLHGSPGTGKSVILAELVNWLQLSNLSVFHHFCTYMYASSTTYDGILRSLLLQIVRHDGDLVKHIYQDFVLARKQPNVSTLERLLQTATSASSHKPRQPEFLWLLVDALNECEVTKQQRLVSLLNQLSSSTTGQTIVKVLITTRKLPSNLPKRIRNNHMLSLNDEESSLTPAIRTYTSCRLKLIEPRLHEIDMDTNDTKDLALLIAQKAQGMFLYARLVLDYIATNVFFDGDELRAEIDKLPQSLADFYNKLLMQILKNLNDTSQCRVKTVFSWIAFAKRPLRKLELLSALSFSDGKMDSKKLPPSYILDDTCGPLLSVKQDTTLTFIHVTVKDYLESEGSPLLISESDAGCQQSIALISCLLSGLEVFSADYDVRTRELRMVKGLHGLHIYATEYWADSLLTAATENGQYTTSVLSLATFLANRLELIAPAPYTHDTQEVQLKPLAPYTLLHKHVQWALQGRSQKRLDQEVFGKSNAPLALDGISSMLSTYQQTVKSILDIDSLPGASAEDLDVFKSQFCNSAYTCRLRGCPRATLGFDTAHLRYEHELSHAGGIRCPVTGCQFPPFRNAQTLKTHASKHHTTTPTWKPIRFQTRYTEQQQSVIISGFARSLWTNLIPRLRAAYMKEIDDWPEDTKAQYRSQGIDPLFVKCRQAAFEMLMTGKVAQDRIDDFLNTGLEHSS